MAECVDVNLVLARNFKNVVDKLCKALGVVYLTQTPVRVENIDIFFGYVFGNVSVDFLFGYKVSFSVCLECGNGGLLCVVGVGGYVVFRCAVGVAGHLTELYAYKVIDTADKQVAVAAENV